MEIMNDGAYCFNHVPSIYLDTEDMAIIIGSHPDALWSAKLKDFGGLKDWEITAGERISSIETKAAGGE